MSHLKAEFLFLASSRRGSQGDWKHEEDSTLFASFADGGDCVQGLRRVLKELRIARSWQPAKEMGTLVLQPQGIVFCQE